MDVNLVKNIAIILDFVISIVASSIQKSKPELSKKMFAASAVVLFVAVVCVVVEFFVK